MLRSAFRSSSALFALSLCVCGWVWVCYVRVWVCVMCACGCGDNAVPPEEKGVAGEIQRMSAVVRWASPAPPRRNQYSAKWGGPEDLSNIYIYMYYYYYYGPE